VKRETQRRPPGTIDKSKIVITRDGSNDNEDGGGGDDDDDVDDDAEDIARERWRIPRASLASRFRTERIAAVPPSFACHKASIISRATRERERERERECAS